MSNANGDSSDDEGQAFYVGGSEHSGQQVVGPKKSKKPAKLIQGLFDSAKAHGAEVVDGDDDGEGGKPSSSARAFRGTGYKLGETNEDTEVIPDTSLPSAKPMNLVLCLYKNGFTIKGDGLDEQLKSYSDPENAKMLNTISKGEVPQELVDMAKGGRVNMNMEDHREEDFVPPKKKMQAFSGSGQCLGSPTPAFTMSTSASTSQAPEPTVSVDENSPTTTLQIKLANGTRKVQKFNQHHTVGDVRQFVAALPGFEAVTFQLQTNFPVQVLDDDSKTLKDAHLLNATVFQKVV